MKPLVLIVLDGWGIRSEKKGNAIAQAKLPFWNEALRKFPHTELKASEEAVGLPPGQMGNSEVGHLNLGAGRIVYQDLLRINRAIQDKSFFKNPVFVQACQTTVKNNSALHLMGLVSDGGVHSHQEHLYALLRLAKEQKVKNVFIHAILDGRDVPPKSALGYLQALENLLQKEKTGQNGQNGKIATVSGRYYTMDRDKRWERTELGFQAIVHGQGTPASSAVEAIEQAYAQGETDEFVKPRVIHSQPASEKDTFIFFNFRPDRARQITRAITDSGKPAYFGCMTLYDKTFTLPIAFPPESLRNLFGELVSKKGIQQLRTAETEKYAHVTYFFNGREEKPFPGEERILIPSTQEVPTYDKKPEMSAAQVTETVLKALDQKKFGFILVNFANPDMVGHTGVMEAAIRAIETVDHCLAKIADKILALDGTLLITADHGNVEQMTNDETGQPHTAHTTFPVPLVLISKDTKSIRLKPGILADVAPTLLALLGWPQPSDMTGHPLLTYPCI
ncbi:MAG: 2,3-bisphosphoglycerate-independent phosphoglycerate mutase [Deltaproteobacteria bacterium]|nr:2,3-bisphosphoglycerate-independent phosphoglycerate mutase [Deltaproteobacteria bacterium]